MRLASKTELSAALIASEEERLRVSKALVDLQIENNRVAEDGESKNFELVNKVCALHMHALLFVLSRHIPPRLPPSTHTHMPTQTYTCIYNLLAHEALVNLKFLSCVYKCTIVAVFWLYTFALLDCNLYCCFIASRYLDRRDTYPCTLR
eukprot:Opistho-2@53783